MLGPPGVGKTCMVHRWFFGEFPTVVNPTFCVYGSLVKGALIWDTAGQEKFAPVAATILNKANAAVIVVDADSMAEFPGPLGFYADMCEGRRVPFVVAVNKADLLGRSTKAVELAEAVSASVGAEAVIAVSALSGDGMDDLLLQAIATAEKNKRMEIVPVPITAEENKAIKHCC